LFNENHVNKSGPLTYIRAAHHVVSPGSDVGHVEHLREGVDPHVHDLHGVQGVVDVSQDPDGRLPDHDVRVVLLRLLADELLLRKSEKRSINQSEGDRRKRRKRICGR